VRGPIEITGVSPWIYGLAIGSGLILLIIIAWLLYLKLRPETTPKPADPDASVLQDIEAALQFQHDPAQASVCLSEALRSYLQATLTGPKPGQTSAELIRQLAQHPIFGPDRTRRLKQLFQELDQIKFAPCSSAATENSIPKLCEETRLLVCEVKAENDRIKQSTEGHRK